MAEHTPGPWMMERRNRYAVDVFVSPDADHDISGRLIAGVADTTGRGDADANLIAAAPDLLEAARHAVMEWRLHGQLTDSCRVLEAAIAKAEAPSKRERTT